VAEDRFVIIGGGADPLTSQVSIERNVLWMQALFGQRQIPVNTYYSGGAHAERDVRVRDLDYDKRAGYEALLRVFSDPGRLHEFLRTNQIEEVDGAAEKDSVLKALATSASGLGADDSFLIMFSGHGGRGSGQSGNYLRLWNDTRLSVSELAGALDGNAATTRLILPQCFSGGFSRVIFDDSDVQDLRNVNGRRCAFMSVSATEESEGCTTGLDTADYRDYATYFFASLAGEDRLGNTVGDQGDLNGDGQISLREAHYYVVVHGYSADVPRTTSEYFLESWDHWATRWLSVESEPGLYSELAGQLAASLGEAATDPFEHRLDLSRQIESHEKARAQLNREVAEVRAVLSTRLETETRFSVPSDHEWLYDDDVTPEEWLRLSDWLAAQSEYPELTARQEKIEGIDLEQLRLLRQRASITRYQRLLKLARLQTQFQRLASAAEQAAYESLVACEDWVPFEKVPGRIDSSSSNLEVQQ